MLAALRRFGSEEARLCLLRSAVGRNACVLSAASKARSTSAQYLTHPWRDQQSVPIRIQNAHSAPRLTWGTRARYGAIFRQRDNLPTASWLGPWHRAFTPPWGSAGVNSALHDVTASTSLTLTPEQNGEADVKGPICSAIFVCLSFMLRSSIASGSPRCVAT